MPVIDNTQLERLETSLRQGDYAAVRDFVRSLSRSEIPDRLILRLSQLARRIDCAHLGLVWLRNRIFDLPPGQLADPREQAEYAMCIMRLGGNSEARRLLLKVPHAQAPEVLKYLAFTYIYEWDYESVIPLMREYIARPDITEYDRLVGRLNFLAALVGTDNYTEAIVGLELLLKDLEGKSHRLLVGNTCELLTQARIYTGDFSQVDELIERSWQALKEAQPRYQLYLQKWRAVAALKRNPEPTLGLEMLRKIRAEAVSLCTWELLRECDFYESLSVGNESMFCHLYFGTPHAAYRKRILRANQGQLSIPDPFNWGPENPKHFLDIERGREQNDRVILKKRQVLHRLARALTSDFYSPPSVAELFAQVFDEEQFHPETSPHRIYEILRRLKAQLRKAGLTLPVESVKRGFKIYTEEGDCALRITATRPASTGLLHTIEFHFGRSEFRAREFANQLCLPQTTAYRELKRLAEAKTLEVLGKGAETRYRLAG